MITHNAFIKKIKILDLDLDLVLLIITFLLKMGGGLTSLFIYLWKKHV